MADDRRRDAPDEPTTGQRVHRDIANLATDSTISAPGVTPDLLAAGLAQLDAERAADSNRRADPAFDPLGATLDHTTDPHAIGSAGTTRAAAPAALAALAGGTLDLPAADQVASAGDLDPGQVIGHFVIRSRLGEGGMGVVLAGHDADLGRPVAIKVVKDEHPAYRKRLLREAQVMARLEHPNVVRVYEVGSDRGRLFVAMQLVDGVTLHTWLKVQHRAWREILAMFQQVGAGLAAVHRAGLVHRDFKPDNVLVDRDGRARVADFGLARLDPERTTLPPELAASLTRTGMMVGTPAYMAPEQHFGGDVDARADQYSFCISLREALIGSRPIKIEDAHWGAVPRPIRAAINRGAAVDVHERWPSMEALLDALARGASRKKLVLASAAAGIVLVGGALGAFALLTAEDTVTASPSGDVDHAQVARAEVPPPSTEAARSPAPTSPASPVSPAPTSPAPASPASPASPAPTSQPASPIASRTAPPASPAPTSPIASRTAPPTTPPTTPATTLAAAPKSPAGAKPAASFGNAKSPPPAGATSPTGSTAVGGAVITPMAPVKETEAARKHNAEGPNPAHEMVAAHRGAVRDALRDFGFLGLTLVGDDREADIRELEGKLAAAGDDFERGVIVYAIGQAERARDNCIGAAKHWHEARKLISDTTKLPLDPASKPRRDLAFLFWGRIMVAEQYCNLMNGRALGVADKLQNAMISMWSAKEPERAEVWLAWAIALYETGEHEQGKQLLLQAGRRGGSDKLRAAITAYANAVGLAL